MGDNGYKLQSNANEHFYNYYYKKNLFIRLWNDNELFTLEKDNSNFGENEEKVRSITLAIRVKKDEEIMY
ncbi:hypothetical protein [Paenibacillus macquariensis]|uniref:Uncharacterized protein n=1 Tax=Paenibacillus macquariensis TaxID=948756 RepID=A0ABY1JPG2_9BACL|nr:hypothetical protein [Paenibacillus macquariensis]MEC0091973.1 hypothetical protein [Paenibacillus macquariensis]OAB37453.1 hypothetical protein PMSM_05165 [Paenibacillus macquariensis subsp. macquariensis]SIQ53614.1 hypothetical protein SAMN05421578_102463 [Paenibacillus macquariensis]